MELSCECFEQAFGARRIAALIGRGYRACACGFITQRVRRARIDCVGEIVMGFDDTPAQWRGEAGGAASSYSIALK